MTDSNHPAKPGGKPRSWLMFFLRPVILIPTTLAVLFVGVALAYRSSRLAGIPPIDEIVDRETEGRIDIKPAQNAFTFYERAFRLIPATLDEEAVAKAVDALGTGEVEWDTVSPAAKRSLEKCEAVLAEWKLGTELEKGVEIQPADLEMWYMVETRKSRTISRLALLQSAQCLHEGNPEESWQWLRASFRFSRHLGNPGTLITRVIGAALHAMAREHFITWATHETVTTKHLQAALIDLREINKLTAVFSVILKAEYLTYMRVLSSKERVREYFSYGKRPLKDIPEPLIGGYLFLIAEPQLCQVLTRHVFANHLSQCDLPRWERNIVRVPRVSLFLPTGRETPMLMDPGILGDAVMRSWMTAYLLPQSIHVLNALDREQARQAAYELCLTVEIFRRMHGEYPESLEALVPEFLDQLPRDLFGSKPAERMLMIRREAKVLEESSEENAAPPMPGLIIYSRSGNGTDDGGDIARQTEDIGIRIPISSVRKSN